MENKQMETALFTMAIFAIGAVAVVLFQHSFHTGQIKAAIADPTSQIAPGQTTSFTSQQGNPAGGYSVTGQDGMSSEPTSVFPITSGANWEVD